MQVPSILQGESLNRSVAKTFSVCVNCFTAGWPVLFNCQGTTEAHLARLPLRRRCEVG
jgi:hypothetical protein